MRVDPNAWALTLPVLVAMVALYFQRPDFPLKRMWREVNRAEQASIATWLFAGYSADAKQLRALRHIAWWTAVAGLAMASAASFLSYAGWMG